MRGIFLDLTGLRFGHWVVLTLHPGRTHYGGSVSGLLWLCHCDCGTERAVRGDQLRAGESKSCGCSRREPRPRRITDVSGKRFGRWIVLALHPERSRGGAAMWFCRCDCGTERVVSGNRLRNGGSTSCGCAARDALIKRNTKHGLSGTQAYRTWKHIKNRCFNPRSENYRYYGGRGISVDEPWRENFPAFYAEMGDPPDGQSIDRINPNSSYGPGGKCRWATPLMQVHNRRRAWWRYPKRRRSKRNAKEK